MTSSWCSLPFLPFHHYQGHPCVQIDLHSETDDLSQAGTLPEPDLRLYRPPGYRLALGFSRILQQISTNLVACVGILRSREYDEANHVCWGPPQIQDIQTRSCPEGGYSDLDLEVPYHRISLTRCIPNSGSAEVVVQFNKSRYRSYKPAF